MLANKISRSVKRFFFVCFGLLHFFKLIVFKNVEHNKERRQNTIFFLVSEQIVKNIRYSISEILDINKGLLNSNLFTYD